jgi:hypothetical protein
VIHAVNADTPEFVPKACLERAAASWNGKPLVLYHPKKAGKQCSAQDATVLAEHGMGFIRNSRTVGTKLLQEAWVEKARARALHPEMYKDLEDNRQVEVSVGAFVITDDVPGEFGSKAFKAAWLEATGDHLAFLPGGRGACSIAMGCGAHRAASHLVTAESFELLARAGKYEDCPACKGSGNVDGNPCEACDGEGEMRVADAKNDTKTTQNDGKTAQNDPKLAKNDGKTAQHDGKQRVIHPADDTSVIRPNGTPLKAACGCTNTAACGCKGETIMAEKATRAELIAALTTDRFSGFSEGDVALLEGASEARLEEFRAAAEGRKTEAAAFTRLENEQRNTKALLKINEERLQKAMEPMSKEDYLAKAPAEIKTLLDAHKAQEDMYRGSIIVQLKDLGAHTEDELKAMSTPHLESLAKYARVTVPDYSGQGIPVHRAASANNNDYAPPNPYEAGIRAAQGKVN